MAYTNRDKYKFIKSYNESYNLNDLFISYKFKFLSRLNKMFEYKNLPATIETKEIEQILQNSGTCIFKEVDNNLYVFSAGLGGEPDVYYHPTIAIIANPGLRYNAELKIDSECVLVLNDSLWRGLSDLIDQTCYILAQIDMTIKYNVINSRIPYLVIAPTDQTKEDSDELFKQIEEGTGIHSVVNKFLNSTIQTMPYNNNISATDIIELKQYVLGSFWQEIGLKTPYNMKREAINEFEATLSDLYLLPLADDMLEQRRIGIEKVNKMYGTNIEVDFSSSWKEHRVTMELEKDVMKSEIISEETKEQEDKSEEVSQNENE